MAVRFHDAQGRLVERRLAGLFASTAYTSSVLTIPLISDKVQQILSDSGWARDSHSGAFAMRLFETFPRDELFQAEVSDLDHAQKLMKLIDTLEEDDDVQNVTANFDLSEDVAAQLG